MEASEQQAAEQAQEPQAAQEGVAGPPEPGYGGVGAPPPGEVASGQGVAPGQEVPGADAERNPAEDQAPVATAAQEAVLGDRASRDEQAPLAAEGTPSNVDIPVRTSAPPAELQSGMPLPEDRAAAAAGEEEAAHASAAEQQATERQEATDTALAAERGGEEEKQ